MAYPIEAQTREGSQLLMLPGPYPRINRDPVPQAGICEKDRIVQHLDALRPLNEPWNRERWLAWTRRIDPENKHRISEQVTDKKRPVYFSAEYGLPGMGFNGGLGVLSGDHYLQAVLTQQPGVFLGLGYDYRKKQVVRHYQEGDVYWQDEEAVAIPSAQELGFKKDQNLTVSLQFGDENRVMDVYRYGIGNDVTSLYRIEVGGEVYPDSPNSDARIKHDAALGIGGYQVVKQLQAQGTIEEPPLYHLNESATVLGAMALLDDKTQSFMEQGQDAQTALSNALTYVHTHSLLTNHTLVPAASSTFNQGQCNAFIFSNLHNDTAKGWLQQFINNHGNSLPLGDLALSLAGKYNGVSKLHGKIATHNFTEAFGNRFGRPLDIHPVTNGIFAQRWNLNSYNLLQDKGVIDEFGLPIEDGEFFNQLIDEIPIQDMAAVKQQDIAEFREYLAQGNKLDQFGQVVNLPKDAVIVGEARRFAGYKRRWMNFQDVARFKSILEKNPRAHVILAGKAHPNDDIAKPDVAWVMNNIKDDPVLKDRVHFMVDYDVEFAQFLEKAAHVWVNTPVVGEEACGTSGMKVGLMGTHVSTRDGFYAEMDPDSYYAVEGPTNSQEEYESYYTQLDNAITDAVNTQVWVEKVKESWKGGLLNIAMGARMLRDYAHLQFPPVEKTQEVASLPLAA